MVTLSRGRSMNRRATKHEPDGTGPNNRVYTADAAPHHCGRLALPSAGQMHPACRLRKRTVVSERLVVAGKNIESTGYAVKP